MSDRIVAPWMSFEEGAVLRVGDLIEFHRSGNPQPLPEWQPEVVQEIHITHEFDEKEGRPVTEISWSAIHDYQCLVVVSGTESWGRNEDIRPIAKAK